LHNILTVRSLVSVINIPRYCSEGVTLFSFMCLKDKKEYLFTTLEREGEEVQYLHELIKNYFNSGNNIFSLISV